MLEKINVKKLIPKFFKKLNIEILLLFLFCIFISFSFGSRFLDYDNYNYAIEEMHVYNQSLYSKNINIVGAGYSPRFYANQLMSLLIRILGSSWYGAAAVLIRINYILYAVAAAMISLKLSREHRLLCGVLTSSCLMTGTLISLAFGINGAADVFLGTAIPVALMGISCAIGDKVNWLVAWILVSIAGFLHVHEGMWGGCIVGLLLAAMCIKERKIKKDAIWGLIIYVFSMTLIIAPSLLNTTPVDENLFVQIYAFIRTPHHLLVSSWGKVLIFHSAVLLALCGFSGVLYCKKHMPENYRMLMLQTGLIALFWISLLGIEYYATEIHPNSFIVTMYLPKCFKYITLLGALLLIKYGFLSLDGKRYISAVSLLLIPVLSSNGKYLYIQIVLFTIFFLAEETDIQDKLFEALDDSENKILELLVYLLCLYFAYKKMSEMQTGKYYVYLAFGIILYKFLSEKIWRNYIKTLALPMAALAMGVISTNGFVFHISREGVSYIGGREFTEAGMGSSIYSIAIEFKEKIDGEVIFLADPDSLKSNAFQLISQKSCYVLTKNTPSNKNSLIEWYDRIVEARKIASCSIVELKKYMDEINVDYVLMTAERFDELDNSDLYDAVVRNEDFAVYRKSNRAGTN